MRSIWRGEVAFGLVSVPVRLYPATEPRDVVFYQVHREDGGRIRHRRVCSVDGREVPYSDVAKGYELRSGEMVVLTEEDFADLPLPTARRIDVLQFCPADQVDPILFAKSYYLEPEAAGTRSYVLVRDALARAGRVGIAKVALRQRESLAVLRARGGVIVLETMLWPDEVRTVDFPFLAEQVEVREPELRMAGALIDAMTGEFDPAAYRDAYREALQEVIEAKVAGREVVRPRPPEEEGAPMDLMEALRVSVEAAKRNRAAGRPPGEAAREPAGAESAGESGAEAAGQRRTGRTA